MHLNTAVSALMELVNGILFAEPVAASTPRPGGLLAVLKEAIETLVLMLAPFTPHVAEEWWEQLGHEGGIAFAPWPSFDPDVARAEEAVVPVQVNGRLRGRVVVPADCAEDDIRAAALADPAVAAHVTGKTLVKVIVAGGRLVNLVVR